VEVLVGGTVIAHEWGSLQIMDRMKQRSVAKWRIIHGNIDHFDRNEAVRINDQFGAKLWTGFLADPEEAADDKAMENLRTKCKAMDNHYLADKRRASVSFLNTTAGAIVTSLHTDFLAAEGITLGTIDTGPDVEQALWDQIRISDIIQELAVKGNLVWSIDKDLVLNFQARTANPSPFTLVIDDVLLNSMKVKKSAPQYRNRQFIRGVTDETSSQTETFVGDGSQVSWSVGFPLAQTPTITINAVAQTVDLKSNPTSTADWQYELGDPVITKSGTAPVLNDVIVVVFIGRFKAVIQADNAAEQTSLAITEGVGTGIVEDVLDDNTLTTITAGTERGVGLINTYAQEAKLLTFATRTAGLIAGQILTVNISDHDFNNDDFLIEELRILEARGEDGPVEWMVKASMGPVGRLAIQFWDELLRTGDKVHQAISVGDPDSVAVVKLFNFAKDWVLNEQPEIFEEVFPAVTLFPAAELRPAFELGETVRFIALGDSGVPGVGQLGNELFRKQVTKLTELALTITTIALIAREEANFAILEVGWFGGEDASATVNSGVLIEQASLVHTKNSGEILQITRVDTKIY